MKRFECKKCGIKDALVFHCNYCGDYFCVEHHLPESHNCPRKPKPDGTSWFVRPEPLEQKLNKLLSNVPNRQKNKHWKKVAGVFAILIIVGLLLWAAFPFIQQAAKNPSTPSQTPMATPIFSTPYTSNTSPPTTAYVEVDYHLFGWFYGNGFIGYNSQTGNELPNPDYNYTYLLMNVTITNHGYSQVNVMGQNGFTVVINNCKFQTYSISASLLSIISLSLTNSTSSIMFYDIFQSELPNPATLLNTGTVSGVVCFQFGDPTIYPHPAQILNEPFTLQYSVTYGNNATLSGPNARVVINQK